MNKKLIVIILASLWLTACSSQQIDLTSNKSPSVDVSKPPSLTAFNRDAYLFNKSIDTGVIKPLAKGYRNITPEFINRGITNVFSNLADVPNALNGLLQFKLKDAASDTGRFVVNSTLGLGGVFDIATKMKLQKHHEDFGQTLAVWGVPSGEYIMLPILGPSTMRDGVGTIIDTVTNPSFFFKDSLAYYTLDKIDQRADLLSVDGLLKDMSDDDYNSLRDAWLQKRKYLISDGKLDQKAIEKKKSLIDELEDLD